MSSLSRVLVALVMMAAGLSIAAAPATAACSPTPYGGCVRTDTKISAPNSVKAGKRVDICARVGVAGNVAPSGRLKITLKGPGGYSKTSAFNVNGDRKKCVDTKLKKAGSYKITADFSGDEGFRDSKDTDSLKVKKKKKK